MDRRELLRRLGVAGLALPTLAVLDTVKVPELVKRPAPIMPLLSLATPGSRLLEVNVATDLGFSRWIAAPGEEIYVSNAIVITVARI